MIKQRLIAEGWTYVGKCGMCAGTPEKWVKGQYLMKIRSGRVEWFKLHKQGRPIASGVNIEQLEQALAIAV